MPVLVPFTLWQCGECRALKACLINFWANTWGLPADEVVNWENDARLKEKDV